MSIPQYKFQQRQTSLLDQLERCSPARSVLRR